VQFRVHPAPGAAVQASLGHLFFVARPVAVRWDFR
jgi:hypothetical protein